MPIVTKVCTHCGVEFSGPKFSTWDRLFCSHSCYTASKETIHPGMIFGRLTAVSKSDKKRWNCVCSCGRSTVTPVQNLNSGKAKSCGCLARELVSERGTKHGNGRHGVHRTKAYHTWDGMIQRCTNPNFKQWGDYGGRGITVCEEWRDFATFLADMGQPPDGFTIDRINNNLGYNKDNCRWVSRKEQQRNRRNSHIITIDGQTKSIIEWSEILGIAIHTVHSRLQRGWTELEALGVEERNTPKRTSYIRSDARWVEHQGQRMILADWCRHLGIKSKTVYSRLMRGATELEALGLA